MPRTTKDLIEEGLFGRAPRPLHRPERRVLRYGRHSPSRARVARRWANSAIPGTTAPRHQMILAVIIDGEGRPVCSGDVAQQYGGRHSPAAGGRSPASAVRCRPRMCGRRSGHGLGRHHHGSGFAIDPERLAADARFDSLYVLPTNAKLYVIQVASVSVVVETGPRPSSGRQVVPSAHRDGRCLRQGLSGHRGRPAPDGAQDQHAATTIREGDYRKSFGVNLVPRSYRRRITS